MKFKEMYPQYSAIERHVRAARVQRAVYLAEAIVNGITFITRGLRKVSESLGRNLKAEADRRAIESDAFLKRSVPKY